MRSVLVQIYNGVICGEKNILKKYQHLLNQPIVIECLPACSCGHQFEEHPSQVVDNVDDQLTQILDIIKLGKCRCLVDQDHLTTKQVVKYLSHVVASMGDVDMFEYLVQQGCGMDQQTTVYGYTPLFIAVMRNDVTLVKHILTLDDVGVNIQCKMEKYTPLMQALIDKSITIVDMLMSVPSINVNLPNFLNETPLIVAAKTDHSEFVTKLLQAGADPDVKDIEGMTALMHVVRFGLTDITNILLLGGATVDVTDYQNETALQFAVCRKDVHLVSMLLEAGANPNLVPDDGFPAIVVAAFNNSCEIIKLLLENGATISSTNNQQYSALHIAAWNGYMELVQTLLTHSAPHDHRTTDKNTPLSLAVRRHHTEVVKLLLSYGCDVNNSDSDLNTPLHYVSLSDDVETVNLLLQHGADPDVKNKINATPVWNAVYSRNTAIIKLLLKHNADLYVPSVGTNRGSQTDDVTILYDTPRTPLWVAVARNAPEVVLLLLSAGYNVSKENWIPGELPEAVSNSETISRLLRYYKCTPLTLRSICRNFIRQYFGKHVEGKAKSLNTLPTDLRNYILLKGILD